MTGIWLGAKKGVVETCCKCLKLRRVSIVAAVERGVMGGGLRCGLVKSRSE